MDMRLLMVVLLLLVGCSESNHSISLVELDDYIEHSSASRGIASIVSGNSGKMGRDLDKVREGAEFYLSLAGDMAVNYSASSLEIETKDFAQQATYLSFLELGQLQVQLKEDMEKFVENESEL